MMANERVGANGQPIQKKIVTWDEHVASSQPLQEILEVNPNAAEAETEEVEVEEKAEKRKKWK